MYQVTTFFYHSQSNGKVESLFKNLNDILAKKIRDNDCPCNLYINQMLAAFRFNVSEFTKFSLFYLLYCRDIILPLDNVLKRHHVDDHHEIALLERHFYFSQEQSKES